MIEREIESNRQNVTAPHIRWTGGPTEDVPYHVYFNAKKANHLYKTLGFTNLEIEDIDIEVKRKFRGHPFTWLTGKEVLGGFNVFSKTTKIYADWFIKRYEMDSYTAERIANHKERIWPLKRRDRKKMERPLTTKRLASYLEKVPPERSVPFARKLIFSSNQRLFNDIILHEETHRRDDKLKNRAYYSSWGAKLGTILSTNILLNNFTDVRHVSGNPIIDIVASNIIYVGAALTALYWEYKVDPMERSANKFMKAHSHNPEFQEILRIEPKAPDGK